MIKSRAGKTQTRRTDGRGASARGCLCLTYRSPPRSEVHCAGAVEALVKGVPGPLAEGEDTGRRSFRVVPQCPAPRGARHHRSRA